MAILPFMFVVLSLLSFSSQVSSETDDTITPQFKPLLRDDGTTLVNGTFVFGFFSPGNSTKRYIGIWFKDVSVKTVVWVANRDNPISDTSGILSIVNGNLVLLSNNGTTHHWSKNITTITKRSSGIIAARLLLLGNGNLVVTRDNDDHQEGYLWQSFDYPTDTLLPGMKLGWNLISGLNGRLIAWKKWDDPSSGNLTYGFIRSYNNPQQQMWNGSSMLYRSGFWNGMRFSATTKLKHRPLFMVDFVQKKNEYYFTYKPIDPSLISRIVINQTVNSLQRLTWIGGRWNLYLNVPRDECDHYNRCGSYGNCAMIVDSESSTCKCLSGFTPKSPQNWTAKEWSQGCVRNGTWSCKEKNKDGFIKIQNLKVSDTNTSWINRSMTLEECKVRCWENCSCTAYANTNITGDGSGCIIWFGDLLDMRQLPEFGQDLYVRFAPLEIANHDAKDGSRKMVVVITCTISIIMMLLVFTFICWKRKTKSKEIVKRRLKKSISTQEDIELPPFDFGTVVFATNDFSNDNKLGEGGFGPVYKILPKVNF